MLVINDERFAKRAEIIWEKGTNRSAFFRGEIDKYGWVDVGSSFLPSEITAAFLWAQLESLDDIQARRGEIWQYYWDELSHWGEQNAIELPSIPYGATNNAHIFYLMLPSAIAREHLITHLRKSDILTVFHYISLHKSVFYQNRYDGQELPNSDRISDCLVRLPMYYDLSERDLGRIVEVIRETNF
jgi:dTDP-4-amino-4,6-dideoxygalactose transaminase